MARICEVARVDCRALTFPENATPDVAAVKKAIADDPAVMHVAVVHCETTTGIINPIEEIGERCKLTASVGGGVLWHSRPRRRPPGGARGNGCTAEGGCATTANEKPRVSVPR